MSASYIARMRTLFYLLDRNKDRILTKEEMFDQHSKSYDTKEANSVPRAVADIWDVLAPSGQLTIEQFVENHRKAIQSEEVMKIFEPIYKKMYKAQFVAMDTNEDGVISLDEYEDYVLKFWGHVPNYKEIALATFTAVDTNQDGKISLEEHITWKFKYCLSDNASDPITAWGWLLSEDDWNEYHNK